MDTLLILPRSRRLSLMMTRRFDLHFRCMDQSITGLFSSLRIWRTQSSCRSLGKNDEGFYVGGTTSLFIWEDSIGTMQSRTDFQQRMERRRSRCSWEEKKSSLPSLWFLGFWGIHFLPVISTATEDEIKDALGTIKINWCTNTHSSTSM